MLDFLFTAFVLGGAICLAGQLFMDLTKAKITPAHVLVAFILLGVVLGALGLYEPLVAWGGAGATVPLSGFGAGLAKGVIEGVQAEGFIGALAGGVEAAAAGIGAAVVFGLFVALAFNPKG